MKKILFSSCLAVASAFSLLAAGGAQATEVVDADNLKTEDSALFDQFNSTVNTERLAINEATLPELVADTLAWDGLSSSIDVYFINEGALHRNQLLFSTNNGEKTMLFEDIASPESIAYSDADGPLSLGDGKSILGLSGDVEIDFFLKANGANNPNGSIFGTDISQNSDGLQHVIAREFQTATDSWVLLGFEDVGGTGSDRDFNDAVIAVRGLTGSRVAEEVPEPMTAVGLIFVGALGLAQKRRQQTVG